MAMAEYIKLAIAVPMACIVGVRLSVGIDTFRVGQIIESFEKERVDESYIKPYRDWLDKGTFYRLTHTPEEYIRSSQRLS